MTKYFTSKYDDANALYDSSAYDMDIAITSRNGSVSVEAVRTKYRLGSVNVELVNNQYRAGSLTVEIEVKNYRSGQLTVRSGKIVFINGKEYTKYVVIEPKITKKINEVSKAVVQVIGSQTNTDFDIGNYLVVKSQPYTLFRGTIRKKSLTHSKMEVILEAYDDLIKTTKKIYEDGGSTIKKWEGVDTDTIISDLASKAGLGAGKIDTTGTNYNFSIQTDTISNGLKRNLRLTGYEVYVSSQSDGSDY